MREPTLIVVVVAGVAIGVALVLLARAVRGRDRGYVRLLQAFSERPVRSLDQLVAAGRELLGVSLCSAAMLDQETGLRVVAVSGQPSRPGSDFQLSDSPLCTAVLTSRKPAFVEDVRRTDEIVNAAGVEAWGMRSLVLVPMIYNDRRVGLLTLLHSAPRKYSESDRKFCGVIASKAAGILGDSDTYSSMVEALRLQQAMVIQREAVFAVNAGLYRADTLEMAVQMIVDLAPGVLGVDLCTLTLNTDKEDMARLAAVTNPYGKGLVGRTYQRRGTNGQVVQATRRTYVVEDAREHPGVHPIFAKELNVGSVAYLPLVRPGGAFMGVLSFIRHRPSPFSQDQLNLAEAFAGRSAAALENVELLEQTRRDAQAKTVLLRELNHRVKNNLTSIITLLSFDEPEMSAAAKQWLQRAIDRIRTMARTHDLFAGGIDRVSLEGLIQQTISSLSVICRPGISIRVEVGAEVTLRTDRAVSLAMVLHELCYNAIVHGLGGSHGTVVVRAKLNTPQPVDGKVVPWRIVLEVVDDATASRPAGTTVALERVGGGLGLALVRGLVSRELKGEFQLQSSPEATVARVDFPVDSDDVVQTR